MEHKKALHGSAASYWSREESQDPDRDHDMAEVMKQVQQINEDRRLEKAARMAAIAYHKDDMAKRKARAKGKAQRAARKRHG